MEHLIETSANAPVSPEEIQKQFDQLIHDIEFRSRLIKAAARYCDDPEAAVQKGLENATKNLHRLETIKEATLKPWLIAIVKNAAKDVRKAEHLEKFSQPSKKDSHDRFERMPSGIESPEEAVSREEERHLLEQAIGLLEPDDRQILGLVLQEMGQTEIAKELNLHPTTAGTRSLRAKEKLRLALEELLNRKIPTPPIERKKTQTPRRPRKAPTIPTEETV